MSIMRMGVHLNFDGNCAEAFALYAKVFKTGQLFQMKYSEAPKGPMQMPADWDSKICHTSIPLGEAMLMGCDAPPGSAKPVGGFQVSVETKDQDEVRRIFEGLMDGGNVTMPMGPTFWSPLFGMGTDRFGVGWMVGVQGEAPQA